MHLKDKYKGFSAEVKEHLMKLENAIFANITGNFTIPKNRLKNFEDFSGTKFSINIDTSISPLEKQKLKEYYFGDQLNYIVFDCQNPSVILYNKTKINGLFKEAVVLNSNQLKVQNYECINDVWQSKGNFLLYDKERLTFDELQMEKLALIFARNMCGQFLRFLHHPAHVGDKEIDKNGKKYQNGCNKKLLESKLKGFLKESMKDTKTNNFN